MFSRLSPFTGGLAMAAVLLSAANACVAQDVVISNSRSLDFGPS
jgi:hypothetical protein